MFNLTENISLKLAEFDLFHLLDAGIPGKTSALLINYVYERLISIMKNSLDIFETKVDAPAFRTRGNRAYSSPAVVFSNAVGAKFPSDSAWKSVYSNDKECYLIM